MHACDFSKDKFLVASCSADGLVNLAVMQHNGQGEAKPVENQGLKLEKRRLPLEVNLTRLDFCSMILLSVGCDDGSIQLYISEFEQLKFQKSIEIVGHSDWLISLKSLKISNDCTFLASASQDSTVRLWKIYFGNSTSDDEEEKIENMCQSASIRAGIEKSSINFDVPWRPNCRVFIRLETILKGHTDWVYTVDMCLDETTKMMSVLTCSVDRSVIVWQEPSDRNSEGIWTEAARFARIGGTGSAAGMSYCGATFAHRGQTVVAHSFTGALHAWRKVSNGWVSIPMPSGHLGQVAGLAWEPSKGQYLLSNGIDQTTRLHSNWQAVQQWYEFGRPQVHGYGFNSIAALNSNVFVSAADEKAMRIFSMPNLVQHLLKRLCNFETTQAENSVMGATVAPLGLTNRPYGAESDDENDEDEENVNEDDDDEGGSKNKATAKKKSETSEGVTQVSIVNDEQPPTPEVLIQHTLWPEMRKLYGHGSEVYSVDISPENSQFPQLIASSCKVTSFLFTFN